jgi:hypothetical protein
VNVARNARPNAKAKYLGTPFTKNEAGHIMPANKMPAQKKYLAGRLNLKIVTSPLASAGSL